LKLYSISARIIKTTHEVGLTRVAPGRTRGKEPVPGNPRSGLLLINLVMSTPRQSPDTEANQSYE